MLDDYIKKEYHHWLEEAKDDLDLVKELKSISNNEDKIIDAFYRNLEFGTGGLRGVIGAGTNRMNIYVIRKASQGLANYLKKEYKENIEIAISYDSRIKSLLFAKTAAEVFASNGFVVHIFKELMPTPLVSYATRKLNCKAGIMVTASHNPAKYNGYKVYGSDGCQITTEAAKEILAKINALDIFECKNYSKFDDLLKEKKIKYIDDSLLDDFIDEVLNESVLKEEIDKNVKIVYTPLNGTGLVPILKTLKRAGFCSVFVVKEQEKPDGNFPTCPFPNPEIREAMELGIKYAKEVDADLLIATDPDCDRVGIAVKDKNDFVLLSGNQTGVLLFDFICSMRIKNKSMPENPVLVKTIVTTDMAKKVADYYGVEVKDVLTGFKFIGEQIGILEQKHMQNRYIFGFEESYGYLSGTYVRDKDAVDGTFLITEMFGYYKSKGISLLEKLNELYKKFGYCGNYLDTYKFEGISGFNRMKEIMNLFRNNVNSIAGFKILNKVDYSLGIDGLPKSNVIKMYLEKDINVVIRPSGTEPKIKTYIEISCDSVEESQLNYNKILECLKELIK